MMKKYSFYTLLALIFLLIGCTSSIYRHKPPEKVTVNNEKFINKPIHKAWGSVASLFFSDTFKLETSDKQAGTLVATFKTDRPINYIDCGIVKRQYRDNEKITHEYTYNYADTTEYSYLKNDQMYKAEVKTNLLTEITTHIAPLRDGTNISVNTQYTLNREVVSTNTVDGTKLAPETEQIKFSTTEPYKTDEFSCISNGAIEHNILSNLN